MQNPVLKFLFLFSLIIFTTSTASKGQSATFSLTRADSLFQQKRYTQSFEVYQSILDRHEYSPAMLLKMAYIQEGLNHIAQSVYYLNLYYRVTQDETVLLKMEEVANKYRLEGYAPSEAETLYVLYRQHHLKITLGIVVTLVFIFTLISVQRVRYQKRPYAAGALLLIFSTVLLLHLHWGEGRTNAIISKNNTYIMDGPSAGASVVSIVRDGHRVKMKGKNDVWVKVEWGDKDAYIKETNLLPVTL
jgi:hypothetical protein